MNVVLLATAWGPMLGGVNAFNEGLALGLANCPVVGPTSACRVFCMVPFCSDEEIVTARLQQVTLLTLGAARDSDPSFECFEARQLVGHAELPVFSPDDFWIGHDIYSGKAAIEAAKLTSCKSAVILHTSPEHYRHLGGNDNDTERRHSEQRQIFQSATHCFAVGPLLRETLRSLVRSDQSVHMLVPGFPEIAARTSPSGLRAITLGRLDQKDEILKQGLLVSESFGAASKKLRNQTEDQGNSDTNILLKVYGVSDETHQIKFKDVAEQAAGRPIPVITLPFDKDRTEIYAALAEANLALVPSLHDGFNLVGWEAIAAETPLILSKQTGLWQYLVEVCSPSVAKALVTGVHIDGARGAPGQPNYTQGDVDTISDAILAFVANLSDRIRAASFLKELLLRRRDGCSWQKTAEEFLIAIEAIEATEVAEQPFVGDWMAFFVEGPPLRPATVYEEKIKIRRNGADLEGSSSYDACEGTREETLSDLKVRLGVLCGYTTARSGYMTGCWSQFQLTRRSSGRLLEGIVSWSSTIEPAVDWSRYIWVKDGPDSAELIAFAKAEMEIERQAVERRFKDRGRRPYPGDEPQLTAYTSPAD